MVYTQPATAQGQVQRVPQLRMQSNMQRVQRPMGSIRPITPPQQTISTNVMQPPTPNQQPGQLIQGQQMPAGSMTVATSVGAQRLLIKSPPQYQVTNSAGQLVAMRPTQLPPNAVRGQWPNDQQVQTIGLGHHQVVRLSQPVILSPNVGAIGQPQQPHQQQQMIQQHAIGQSNQPQQVGQLMNSTQLAQTVAGQQILQPNSAVWQPIANGGMKTLVATGVNSFHPQSNVVGPAGAVTAVVNRGPVQQSGAARFQLSPQQAAEANSQVRMGLNNNHNHSNNSNSLSTTSTLLVTSRTKSALANLLNHRLNQSQAGIASSSVYSSASSNFSSLFSDVKNVVKMESNTSDSVASFAPLAPFPFASSSSSSSSSFSSSSSSISSFNAQINSAHSLSNFNSELDCEISSLVSSFGLRDLFFSFSLPVSLFPSTSLSCFLLLSCFFLELFSFNLSLFVLTFFVLIYCIASI